MGDGKRHGPGKMVWIERYYNSKGGLSSKMERRTEYDGCWTDDAMKHGKFTWANGDTYTGPWCGNKKHGWGTYVWADGTIYEGEWQNDKTDRFTGTYNYGKLKYTEKLAKRVMLDLTSDVYNMTSRPLPERVEAINSSGGKYGMPLKYRPW